MGQTTSHPQDATPREPGPAPVSSPINLVSDTTDNSSTRNVTRREQLRRRFGPMLTRSNRSLDRPSASTSPEPVPIASPPSGFLIPPQYTARERQMINDRHEEVFDAQERRRRREQVEHDTFNSDFLTSQRNRRRPLSILGSNRTRHTSADTVLPNRVAGISSLQDVVLEHEEVQGRNRTEQGFRIRTRRSSVQPSSFPRLIEADPAAEGVPAMDFARLDTQDPTVGPQSQDRASSSAARRRNRMSWAGSPSSMGQQDTGFDSRLSRLTRMRQSILGQSTATSTVHNSNSLNVPRINTARPTSDAPSLSAMQQLDAALIQGGSSFADMATYRHTEAGTSQASSSSANARPTSSSFMPSSILSQTPASNPAHRRILSQPSRFRGGRGGSRLLRSQSATGSQTVNEGVLSQVLSLAALSLASRLSGSERLGIDTPSEASPNDVEGSLQNLLRILQSSTHPDANANAPSDTGSPRSTNDSPPLNFVHVFRVVNEGSNSESTSAPSVQNLNDSNTRRRPASSSERERAQDSDDRRVTLVVVGVRSVASSEAPDQEHRAADEDLSSMVNVPRRSVSTGVSNRPGARGSRRLSARPLSMHQTRTSIGSLDPFAQRPEIHDQSQSTPFGSAGDFGTTSLTFDTVRPTGMAPLSPFESPAGPYPPPSTPADNALSVVSSGASTPVRGLSTSSAAHPAVSLDHGAERSFQGGEVIHESSQPPVRQRRRSDSEYARHRGLGAGAARRNGVVGPDNREALPTRPRQRSWLVYVVGAHVSADHPALNLPSLFTDNPSYEDMLLLSSLLGPAKPPVASREDVAAADGSFVVREEAGQLLAYELEGEMARLPIAREDQCLICLDTYRVEEHLRRLNKCSHTFHKDCIDEWLTTGRNTCPLCRTQGVEEKVGAA